MLGLGCFVAVSDGRFGFVMRRLFFHVSVVRVRVSRFNHARPLHLHVFRFVQSDVPPPCSMSIALVSIVWLYVRTVVLNSANNQIMIYVYNSHALHTINRSVILGTIVLATLVLYTLIPPRVVTGITQGGHPHHPWWSLTCCMFLHEFMRSNT